MAAKLTMLLFSVYEDLSSAIAAARHAGEAIRLRDADIDGAAIIARDASRKVIVHQFGDVSGEGTCGRGAVLGAVIGSMFPAVEFASVFVGASIATLFDRVNDIDQMRPTFLELGGQLDIAGGAIIVVGSSDSVNHVAQNLLGYQTLVRRRLTPEFVSAANCRS